jgi:hypothetical protein
MSGTRVERACLEAIIIRLGRQLRRNNDVVVEAPEPFHAVELHDLSDVGNPPSWCELQTYPVDCQTDWQHLLDPLSRYIPSVGAASIEVSRNT